MNKKTNRTLNNTLLTRVRPAYSETNHAFNPNNSTFNLHVRSSCKKEEDMINKCSELYLVYYQITSLN